MALVIQWTPRAAKGYAAIIDYLETHWNEREVSAFNEELQRFLSTLIAHPKLLPASRTRSQYRRGPMNKYTMITYQYLPRKKQIRLINVRSTRQQPQ